MPRTTSRAAVRITWRKVVDVMTSSTIDFSGLRRGAGFGAAPSRFGGAGEVWCAAGC